MIEHVRQRLPNVLVLDAGDSLIGDQTPATRTNGGSSVELMNAMGYDAMALGEGDLLKLGVETIQQHVEKAAFAILSANVVLAETNETLVQPYIIRQVGQRQIAIIGLTGSISDPIAGAVPGIEIVDPLQSLLKVLEKVHAQADTVILLSHASLDANRQLARDLLAHGHSDSIDLIVSGGGPEFLYAPEALDGGPVIVHADASKPGHAGRRIGLGTWSFDADGPLAQYNWYNFGLGPQVPEDPDIAEWAFTHP